MSSQRSYVPIKPNFLVQANRTTRCSTQQQTTCAQRNKLQPIAPKPLPSTGSGVQKSSHRVQQRAPPSATPILKPRNANNTSTTSVGLDLSEKTLSKHRLGGKRKEYSTSQKVSRQQPVLSAAAKSLSCTLESYTREFASSKTSEAISPLISEKVTQEITSSVLQSSDEGSRSFPSTMNVNYSRTFSGKNKPGARPLQEQEVEPSHFFSPPSSPAKYSVTTDSTVLSFQTPTPDPSSTSNSVTSSPSRISSTTPTSHSSPPESYNIEIENNPDYIALTSALALLKTQSEIARGDIRRLKNLKADALQNPEKFIDDLTRTGHIRNAPQMQKIVQIPLIHWEKYGIDNKPLERKVQSGIVENNYLPFVSVRLFDHLTGTGEVG